MQQNLQGKVALVTGATRGIGKGIAVALGAAGAIVYITGRSLNTDTATDGVGGGLAETQAAIARAGGTGIAVPTDHSQDEAVAALFEQIQDQQQGQLDLLINNVYGGVRAIRESQGQPFWQADAGLWDACNNVGLRSHYITSRHGAQLMVQRRQGLIVTLSSWGGLAPLFGVAYGTGKAACDRLAVEMARELKPYNVASMPFWPGVVGTEHIAQAATGQSPQDPSPDSLDMFVARAEAAMRDRFNWEAPDFIGRVIAALAADPQIMERSGKLQIAAELAEEWGITDAQGRSPASLRSLRFLMPLGLPELQPYADWIPDLRIPWWVLLLTTLPAPKL
ncbi:MAG: SDR family NAD(P)-dependent oxidoreductase [Cyanobacteria bacterium P01_G01_bin.54]